MDVRVEALGSQVYGLKVWIDDSFGDDKLAVGWGWPRYDGRAMNGWATGQWDSKRKQAGLNYTDGSGEYVNGVVVTAEELFELLWRKVVEYLEQRHR